MRHTETEFGRTQLSGGGRHAAASAASHHPPPAGPGGSTSSFVAWFVKEERAETSWRKFLVEETGK